MAGKTVLGNLRTTLVDTLTNVASGSTPSFGAHIVSKFSRVHALFSAVGSHTFQYRFGPTSGTWMVSSAFTVNSGASVTDFLAYGSVADFSFTNVVSNTARIFIQGSPER